MYIGEDVQHGGYYLVTEGLHKKHNYRVCDFPPDETTLVGAAMGYSQVGLRPILEIPYAKYLDCASDMFHECVMMHWLTNGSQKNGMLIRLQGFDKGVFGGNYHTHNTLYIPPGLDVVCYSNGFDYVRGIRYAMKQVTKGRVVMSVDSTELLNKRHIQGTDEGMLSMYPALQEGADELSWNEIIVYRSVPTTTSASSVAPTNAINNYNDIRFAVLSYGNGISTCILAIQKLIKENPEVFSINQFVVIDTPYLSGVPQQLEELLSQLSPTVNILFADVCKHNSNMPYNHYITTLQSHTLLPSRWLLVGAANTYNPLSRTITFLTEEIVMNGIKQLTKWKETRV